MRSRLTTQAMRHVAKAAEKLVESPTERLSDPDWEEFERAVGRAVRMSALSENLERLEQRLGVDARVTGEARVYGPHSPHSYCRDLGEGVKATGGGGFGDLSGAQQRMARYDRELAYEVRAGSPEGQRVERALGEYYRSEAVELNRDVVERKRAELRALVTGGGATASATSGGAALVSPYFVWEALAPYRGIHRAFADQCGAQPLPPWGMQAYIPAFTTGDSVTDQTEGQAVSEVDPVTGYQGAQVQTVTGMVTMSQQLHDRGFTGGGSFDTQMGKQLQQQLDEAIEKYVIAQALNSAATVAGQSSFTIGGLYQDLASGREKLTDTAGTRLRPTHCFTTSDLYSYVTRQVDDQHRPIVVPTFAPGFPIAAGDSSAKWSRFTGTVLPGGVLWFEADGIPPAGTTNQCQLLVSAPDEAMVLLEGEPILDAFPQTDAVQLEVVLRLRAYVAAIARYPSGTATIYGSAYTTALV